MSVLLLILAIIRYFSHWEWRYQNRKSEKYIMVLSQRITHLETWCIDSVVLSQDWKNSTVSHLTCNQVLLSCRIVNTAWASWFTVSDTLLQMIHPKSYFFCLPDLISVPVTFVLPCYTLRPPPICAVSLPDTIWCFCCSNDASLIKTEQTISASLLDLSDSFRDVIYFDVFNLSNAVLCPQWDI